MFRLNFFEAQPFDKAGFQQKINEALEIIKNNPSFIAKKTLEIINAKAITIRSFFEVTEEDYFCLKKDFEEEYCFDLPDCFPPSNSTIRMIEKPLSAILFNGKIMYVNSTETNNTTALTLIHEVSHWLYRQQTRQEKKRMNKNLAIYRDEVHSFTAECMFKNNDKRLSRSQITAIHTKVIKHYPELVSNEEEARKQGFIVGNYGF